ncbi:uncharacterized protein LOC121390919 [Gigantopelta aegis]|uniref:uncharacterized protein LOC121390919 n=1 Tax=Gigantopelta aegis TaxID=1735272 RepID=UPI001B888391|nr:uncharacterized protein LOC121390919 [Gigantopelta aegis]
MGSGNDADQDWYIDGSDDEKYNPAKIPGVVWQPNPKDILEMFDKLSRDKAVLELKWQCPGRRSPELEKDSDEEMDDQEQEDDQEEVVEEEVKAPEPSAFDFDDFGTEPSGNITPRSISGGRKTPHTQKHVARMDKVLDDIRRQQLERNAIKEARRVATRSPGSPANVRFRLGMMGSPGMTRSEITTTPQRPVLGESGMNRSDVTTTPQPAPSADSVSTKQTRPGTPSRENGDGVGNTSSSRQAGLRTGLSPKPAGTPSGGTPAHSPAPPATAVHRQSPGAQQTAPPSTDTFKPGS